MSKLQYIARITGHEAPFKWELRNPTRTHVVGQTGEADSYEDALFQASAVAHRMEYERIHSNTVREECVFEVDSEVETPVWLYDDIPTTHERD